MTGSSSGIIDTGCDTTSRSFDESRACPNRCIHCSALSYTTNKWSLGRICSHKTRRALQREGSSRRRPLVYYLYQWGMRRVQNLSIVMINGGNYYSHWTIYLLPISSTWNIIPMMRSQCRIRSEVDGTTSQLWAQITYPCFAFSCSWACAMYGSR